MANPRNQSIEAVRIAAAFGSVVFHSGSAGAELGYSGLVAFTMLATYFAGSSPGKLARRVLLPWAFWSVFYLGWRFAADGSPFHDGLSPVASILYGTHLWFLPFIFVANLIVATVRWRHLPLICGILGAVMLAASPWLREVQQGMQPPVAQYLHAIPAALLGIAMRERAVLVLAAIGLAICLLWGVPGVSLPYAVGGFAVIAAVLLPQARIKVEWASGCMMGVYLVHIAALGVFNRLVGPGTLLTALAAFIASFAGVWLARRYLPASKAVLG